ncbi:bcl-2-like protein 2 isoform X2 [Exaiptasia diaphana]|uniref:Bcl-2 Bcl-2 homology region 1-3 domain-containing protein n=1 Tax=Exaiptasia diaphana TaxID=2652724 RepID=A0A913XHN4_EXADI|nr:bcl-2-like protein 2 isoform X2 [Exaiptasia diaphana]
MRETLRVESGAQESMTMKRMNAGQEAGNDAVRKLHQQAHFLARDIVCYRTGNGEVSRNLTAQNMRRLSDELEQCHHLLLNNMCNTLNMTSDTAHQKFVQIADEVFRDGVNWGRIVALFTFGGRLAQFCARNGMQHNVDDVEQWLGDYISGLSSWILKQGGWESFDNHFKDPSTRQKTGWWTGILLATVGIGTLATFVYKQC